MKEVARIPLPTHAPDGGFDHAAVDAPSDRLYVAHTSNDAVEVVDLADRRHLRTLPGLRGVAGVWVDSEHELLFTSNRGEDTATIFRIGNSGEKELFRVPTGARPNGMAFDPGRQILMVAGVGNAQLPDAPPTLTFVDVRDGRTISSLRVPGRTRWALFHEPSDRFYVNIADPAQILGVAAGQTTEVARTYSIPAKGPHGLEQDPGGRVLYCACDEGTLLTLDLEDGAVRSSLKLSGPPDVLWLNRHLKRLYCAVGEPGSVDPFGVSPVSPLPGVRTAVGAHTLTVDPRRDEVHVFLPESHEDLVLKDSDEG